MNYIISNLRCETHTGGKKSMDIEDQKSINSTRVPEAPWNKNLWEDALGFSHFFLYFPDIELSILHALPYF